MVDPRVPGDRDNAMVLSCGETIRIHSLDMGLREFDCDCGANHGVVMDVHPPTRFLPEFFVDVLESVIETTDEFDSFGTPHLMGLVLEEFPESVIAKDVSGDGTVGYAMVWVTDFSSRRLHEIIVELVLELMDHAMQHAENEEAVREFTDLLHQFDIDEFVTQYRDERDLSADDFPGYNRG